MPLPVLVLLLGYLPDSPHVAGEKKERTGNGHTEFVYGNPEG